MTANVNDNSSDLRVLFTPFYDENPYQKMYKSALEDRGISVFEHRDPMPFSLLLLVAVRNQVNVIHQHWTHPFFLYGSKRWLYRIPGTRILSVVAALVFLAQIVLLRVFCDQIVWTVHNRQNHEKQYLALDHWVSKQIANQADVVQVWDEHTATVVQEMFDVPETKLVEIPHGNFSPEYDPYSGPDPTVELGVDDYDRVFLFFGMIRPYKNVLPLIRTFDAVSSPQDCLLIAGNPMDDRLHTSVKSAAAQANNIHTQLEYIPDSAVPKYFAAADICVFPYGDIFNSGSIILAMTFGKPFVAPRKGAIPSVAPEGNLLYEDLNEAITDARAMSEETLTAVGETNRRVALTAHDWDDIARQTEQAYRAENDYQ